MGDKIKMIPNPEYIAEQAEFVRNKIMEEGVFLVEIDPDNQDMMLVAAFCLGAQMFYDDNE